MSHKVLLFGGLALMAVGALLVGSASAESVPISNASFEIPVLSDGGEARPSSTVSNWWGASPAYWYFFNPPGEPSVNGFYDASGNGTPRGGDGTNILAIYMGGSTWRGTTGGGSNFLTGQVLQEGVYTLTVGVGEMINFAAANFDISFGTSSDPLLSTYSGLGSELTAGEFVDRSTVLTVGSDHPNLGETLKISLKAIGSPTQDQQLAFDNVRLDFSPVPEPSTLAILAGGLLAAICLVWRREK